MSQTANIPATSDVGNGQNSVQVIQKHNPTDAKNWFYRYVEATITIQKNGMGAVQLDTLQKSLIDCSSTNAKDNYKRNPKRHSVPKPVHLHGLRTAHDHFQRSFTEILHANLQCTNDWQHVPPCCSIKLFTRLKTKFGIICRINA